MDPTLIAGAIVILLFSIIVHEVMHGLVALKFGDHTAQRAGRLTLNPIPHIDPIGSILVPLSLFIIGSPIMFGWAKRELAKKRKKLAKLVRICYILE